jgi:CubicO group peptidase (beta-lactamase class C family)
LTNNLTNLPGNRAGYSDLAYTLLGFAIENITGKTYQDLIKEKITDPLSLDSTSFEVPNISRAIIPEDMGAMWFSLDISNYKS